MSNLSNRHDNRRHVLLVSSDLGLHTHVSDPFALAKCSLASAPTADAARKYLDRRRFDLILLDLSTAQRRGLQLLRAIRNSRNSRNTPVIAIASPDDADFIFAGLKAGANHFVTKPVSVFVLVACAQVLLEEAPVKEELVRRQELIDELERIETRLSETTRRQAQLQAVSVHETLDGAPETPLRDTVEAPASWHPHDTTELATVDWVLFQAIEAAFSECMESRHPLSIFLLEVEERVPVEDGLHTSLGDVAGYRAASVLDEAHVLKQIGPQSFLILLPGVEEGHAIRCAQRIIDVIEGAPIDLPSGRTEAHAFIGISSCAPGFEHSPFKLIDWARGAMEQARKRPSSRWWVHHLDAMRTN